MGEIPGAARRHSCHSAVVVMCHHGMRSMQVAHFLLANGFKDVANLDGGIDAWAAVVDPALARY